MERIVGAMDGRRDHSHSTTSTSSKSSKRPEREPTTFRSLAGELKKTTQLAGDYQLLLEVLLNKQDVHFGKLAKGLMFHRIIQEYGRLILTGVAIVYMFFSCVEREVRYEVYGSLYEHFYPPSAMPRLWATACALNAFAYSWANYVVEPVLEFLCMAPDGGLQGVGSMVAH